MVRGGNGPTRVYGHANMDHTHHNVKTITHENRLKKDRGFCLQFSHSSWCSCCLNLQGLCTIIKPPYASIPSVYPHNNIVVVITLL